MTDKMKTERTKVNLKTDKIRLFGEKNSLVVKRKKLRVEIVTMNVARFFNVLIYGQKDLFLRSIQDKLKAKRLILFDNTKKTLQKFFIKIRYYQRIY